MLVILEIEQIVGFSANSNFGLFWDLNYGVMRGSFDDSQGQISVN